MTLHTEKKPSFENLESWAPPKNQGFFHVWVETLDGGKPLGGDNKSHILRKVASASSRTLATHDFKAGAKNKARTLDRCNRDKSP